MPNSIRPTSKKSHAKRRSSVQVVSIGSAVRDIIFYTNQAQIIKNPENDPTRLKLIAFEYGAKIKSGQVSYLFGGGAANTALGFAKLGLRTATFIAVGQDGSGDELVAHLQAGKVQTQFVQRSSQPTGQSFLVVESTTHEHVAFVSYGANETMQVSPAQLKQCPTDWFYVSSLATPNWVELMKRLTRTGAHLAWNPGAGQLQGSVKALRAILPGVTVLILNKDEATELTLRTMRGATASHLSAKNLAQHVHTLGPDLVLITNGRHGAHVYDGQRFYFAKPSPDKPVDTTGAGDCFGSSFIAGLIRFSGDIAQALKLAIVNSTSLVSHTGAQQGLLSWSEASAKLKK